MACSINGIVLYGKDLFYISGRGMVITFTIVEMPENQDSMPSGELSKLLMGQELLGCVVTGVELFASNYQAVGRSIALLLRRKN